VAKDLVSIIFKHFSTQLLDVIHAFFAICIVKGKGAINCMLVQVQ